MDVESRDVESLGKRIRQFFRDLFGSRVLVHLELEKIQLREDYEKRLQDKDVVIASLREEKALLMSKITVYEMTIMPHASRTGAEVVAYQKPTKPAFNFLEIPPEKTRWQKIQEEHDAQMIAELAAEAAKKSETSAATAA
jgi:hypothetical protein